MTPIGDLAVVGPDTDAANALELLAQRDVDQLPVVRGGRLVGRPRRGDVVTWLQLHAREPSR